MRVDDGHFSKLIDYPDNFTRKAYLLGPSSKARDIFSLALKNAKQNIKKKHVSYFLGSYSQ